jgi:hypothetical protein
VAHIHDDLTERIKALEKQLEAALEEKERLIQFHWAKGKVLFEEAVLAQHRKLKSSLGGYILDSRFLAILTAPVIYLGIVPFLLVDFFLVVYQTICFPVYGIPKVRRGDNFIFDRGSLKYLNLVERINCIYCSYGNGLFAYAAEISGRTEQHWCPIKHARRIRAPHLRYRRFLAYGNASQYREQIDTVRNDFVDLRTLKLNRRDPPGQGAGSGEVR